MLQFTKEWVVAAALLAATFAIISGFWKSNEATWQVARGDWKQAAAITVGKFATFAFVAGLGVMILAWSADMTYARLKGSPILQGVGSLASAGVDALAGTFTSVPSIELPETTLVEAIQGAAASIAPQTNAPASAPASVPASNVESAAPASNWGVVREAPAAPTREFIGPVAPTAAPPAPTQGPAPQVVGPQEKPTFVDPGSVFGGGGPATYTVKSGDSMAKIAKAVGLPDYRAICAANRAIVGNDCNVIRSGQVLVIP